MAIYSGNNLVATKGGVSNYSDLDNKPSINDVILVGNKTLDDLNIASKDSIPVSTSQLTNDSGFITTIPEEYVTDTELEAKNYVTTSSLATIATSGSYADVTNKPQINSITLDGNKTLIELDIAASSDLSTIATSGSYNDAENKPQINSVELTGNKTSEELGLQDLDTALNYNSITNCITKIPQDIKLELDNGTLTLKSGSKVYNADGTVYTLDNDLSMTPEWGAVSGTTTNIVVFPTISNNKITGIDAMNLTRVFSGDIAPTFPDNYACWLDITINKVKYTNNGGTTWSENRALPLCLVSTTDHVVTSIDQVFNGMGFIGSTVYVLPGVEGLAPNGFNINGSLNNTLKTSSLIATRTVGSANFNNKSIVYFNASSSLGIQLYDRYSLDRNKNLLIEYNADGTFLRYISGGSAFVCAEFTCDENRVTSLTPKTTFQAIDYNEYSKDITKIKENISDKVSLTKDEEISGIKTFTDDIIAPNQIDYTRITNCITKIPQDIKLELNNGTITLKAGSSGYKCDGNFTKHTTSEDMSQKPTVSAQLFMYIDENNNFAEYFVDRFFSGDSAPTVSSSTAFWYDTTTKKMKKTLDTGGSWFESNISLPMALVTCDATQGITSIDQVFNGCGYIGNTVFALPGIEGLCPNGFNNDGTYNNTIFTLNKVIFGEAATGSATQFMQATLNGILLPSVYNYKIFNNKKEALDFTQLASTMSFDCYIINENKQYYYNQNNTPIFSQNNRFECGTIETDGKRIISFKPSYAFAAVNINQIENIIADTPTSIYQKMFNVPNVTISLQNDKSIYKLSNISANMTLVFGMGSLKKVYKDRVITFELYIPVASTVPTITWPAGVTWLNNEVPTFEANTNYLFAFRSFDQGSTWIGNIQCSWPSA